MVLIKKEGVLKVVSSFSQHYLKAFYL